MLLRPPPSGASEVANMAIKRQHNFNVMAHAAASLTLSARLAMGTWQGEPKVAELASALLAAVARHLLNDPGRSV